MRAPTEEELQEKVTAVRVVENRRTVRYEPRYHDWSIQWENKRENQKRKARKRLRNTRPIESVCGSM